MNNKNWLIPLLALAVLTLAALACGAVKPAEPSAPPAESINAAPTESASMPEATSVAPSEPLAQNTFEGEWTGKTSDDKQFLLRARENEVKYFDFGYFFKIGICSLSGLVGKEVNVPIVDNKFTITLNEGNQKITLEGVFTPDGQVSGKLDYSETFPDCGEGELHTEWTASNTAAQESATAPTEVSGSSAPVSDNGGMVQQFFDVLNAGNTDAALALVDEYVTFNFGSASNSLGSDKMKEYLSSTSGTTYTISNIKPFGDKIVNFSVQVSDGNSYPGSQIFVTDGKITMLMFKK